MKPTTFIMKVYEQFEHKIVSETSRLKKIKLVCEDREKTRPLFRAAIKESGVPYEETDYSPDSSWGHFEFVVDGLTHRVFFKNQKQNACTAYFEGSQCIFLAHRQLYPDTDLTVDVVRQAVSGVDLRLAQHFNIDKQANLCMSKLTSSWADSSIKIANHVVTRLRRDDLVFHRASPATKLIDETFYSVNRGAFTHHDKWNPADIWGVSSEFAPHLKNELNKLPTLDALNKWLEQRLEENDVVPISLKKIDTNADATIYSINTENYRSKPHETAKFIGTKINTGNSDITSSNNCQLSFEKHGKPITNVIRPSSPGSAVNCELKQDKSNAQDGKIHLETVSNCLGQVGYLFDVTCHKWHGKQSKKRNSLIADRIWERVTQFDDPGLTREEFDVRLGKVDDNYLYSMDVGTAVVQAVHSLTTEQQNQFCEALYQNGAAQRADCGPYLKVMSKVS